MAEFTSEEDTLKCIEEVKAGKDFIDAAINNNSFNDPETKVYLDSNDSLPIEVKKVINETDNVGLCDVIAVIESTENSDGTTVETGSWYVIDIVSRDAEDFKDEFIELMASDLDSATVRDYYFDKTAISFFDQDLYELMSEKYEVFK